MLKSIPIDLNLLENMLSQLTHPRIENDLSRPDVGHKQTEGSQNHSLTTWLLLEPYCQVWVFKWKLVDKFHFPGPVSLGASGRSQSLWKATQSPSIFLFFSEAAALISNSDSQLLCYPAFSVKYNVWLHCPLFWLWYQPDQRGPPSPCWISIVETMTFLTASF